LQTQHQNDVRQTLLPLLVALRLFYPDFNSAFYADFLLRQHQIDLSLNKSVVVKFEFFSHGILQLRQRDMLNSTNLVPKVTLYFFPFLGVFHFYPFNHFIVTPFEELNMERAYIVWRKDEEQRMVLRSLVSEDLR
jgi:hypothetical protein